ncbi:MAG TPA: tRNA guanosine(34) transglycosylase Tgt, partial [Alphaproteobacteria bacterium]
MSLYQNFKFDIIKAAPDSRARLGSLTTPHGTIPTPNFIFCGTHAGLRSMTGEEAKAAGAQIVLSNTYHLLVRPGPDIVEKLGGLHKMMVWDGPIMTDSGGFQIFIMGYEGGSDEIKMRGKKAAKKSLIKINEEGAWFYSYKDGSKIHLTPEKSMDVQRALGADLIYQLDECTSSVHGKDYHAKSMRMSLRWGDRCIKRFSETDDGKQALYGIVQGGNYMDLREESAKAINDQNFFGMAIGGYFGKSKDELHDIVAPTMEFVRRDRPVHMLGIGHVEDIFAGVRAGIDTFDCVEPTRLAGHGTMLIKGQPRMRINLRNGKFRGDPTPLDPNSDFHISREFTRGTLHHLVQAQE